MGDTGREGPEVQHQLGGPGPSLGAHMGKRTWSSRCRVCRPPEQGCWPRGSQTCNPSASNAAKAGAGGQGLSVSQRDPSSCRSFQLLIPASVPSDLLLYALHPGGATPDRSLTPESRRREREGPPAIPPRPGDCEDVSQLAFAKGSKEIKAFF